MELDAETEAMILSQLIVMDEFGWDEIEALLLKAPKVVLVQVIKLMIGVNCGR